MKDMYELLKNMDEISKEKEPTREEIFKKLHEERNILKRLFLYNNRKLRIIKLSWLDQQLRLWPSLLFL